MILQAQVSRVLVIQTVQVRLWETTPLHSLEPGSASQTFILHPPLPGGRDKNKVKMPGKSKIPEQDSQV